MDQLSLTLQELASLVGSQTSSLRFFKRELTECLKSESIPEYEVAIVGDPETETGKLVAAAGLLEAPRRFRSNQHLAVIFKRREPPEPAAQDEGDVVVVPNL